MCLSTLRKALETQRALKINMILVKYATQSQQPSCNCLFDVVINISLFVQMWRLDFSSQSFIQVHPLHVSLGTVDQQLFRRGLQTRLNHWQHWVQEHPFQLPVKTWGQSKCHLSRRQRGDLNISNLHLMWDFASFRYWTACLLTWRTDKLLLWWAAVAVAKAPPSSCCRGSTTPKKVL